MYIDYALEYSRSFHELAYNVVGHNIAFDKSILKGEFIRTFTINPLDEEGSIFFARCKPQQIF